MKREITKGILTGTTILYLLYIFMTGSGCAISPIIQPSNPYRTYFINLQQWAERVDKDGWSEDLVDDVVAGCIWVSAYNFGETTATEDGHKTIQAFYRAGMQGQCYQYSLFMLQTLLDYLNYPYQVRILAVHALGGGHALLKVELPDGRWKTYETTRGLPGIVDSMFDRPWLELYFDKEANKWRVAKN